MSKIRKMASIILSVVMLASCGAAFAEAPAEETPVLPEVTAEQTMQPETPAAEPAEEQPAEETETPAPTEEATEQPTVDPTLDPTVEPVVDPTIDPTEAPTKQPDPTKTPVGVGYAKVEGGVVAYTEPVVSDSTRIGQFNSSSYVYVQECIGTGEEGWLKIAFAYEEGSLIGVLEGYIRLPQAAQVEGSTGAGPFILGGVGLSKASFQNNGVLPAVIIDPETGATPGAAKTKYSVNDEGKVVRRSDGAIVSTEKCVVVTSGPALNYRSAKSGTVEGCVESGETVRVIDRSGRWAYVLIDGEICTMMSVYLFDPEEVSERPAETGMTAEAFSSLVGEIEITFRYEGDSVSYGDAVTLVAHIPDALADAEIQWQVKAP
ncbi:MAG: PT domain-containing protein, partial [Candidatus Faecivicinus sp.]|nr:PT domain-containing protein [Candidatus Faecivicinus sp.]